MQAFEEVAVFEFGRLLRSPRNEEQTHIKV